MTSALREGATSTSCRSRTFAFGYIPRISLRLREEIWEFSIETPRCPTNYARKNEEEERETETELEQLLLMTIIFLDDTE